MEVKAAFRDVGSNLKVVRPQRTQSQLGVWGAVSPPLGPGQSPGGAPKALKISLFRNPKMVMLFEYLYSWEVDMKIIKLEGFHPTDFIL